VNSFSEVGFYTGSKARVAKPGAGLREEVSILNYAGLTAKAIGATIGSRCPAMFQSL
jgi:hypothetical protein